MAESASSGTQGSTPVVIENTTEFKESFDKTNIFGVK